MCVSLVSPVPPVQYSTVLYLSVEGLRPLHAKAGVAPVQHLEELGVGLLHEAVGLTAEAHEGRRFLADALRLRLLLLLLLLVLTPLPLATAMASAAVHVRLGAPPPVPPATATASAGPLSTPILLLCHDFTASTMPPGAETGRDDRVVGVRV